MKAYFHRSVNVEAFTVFAKIEVEEERKDIQEFLKKLVNGQKLYEQRVQERICEYLYRIGLLTENGTLTQIGERSYKTGLVPYLEEGKYKFWCVLQDKLIGKRLLAFKREKPEKIKNTRNNEAVSFLDDLVEKQDLCVIIQEKREKNKWRRSASERYCRIKKIASVCNDKSHPKLQLEWIWNGLEGSSYQLKGELIDFDKKETINFEEKLNINIESILLELDPKQAR